MTSDLRLRAAPGRGERQATGGSPEPRAFGSPESVEPFDDAESVDAVELPNAAESVIEVEPHNCFACGSLNEHGLHLDLHVATDRCWTELVLTEAFQGWDGIAHGGIVTTILDEVMAWSLAAADNWGVTAQIAVTFKKPVPIGSPIRAEGWIEDNRRRLIDTAARIVDADGAVLATAEARYVAAGPERKRELRARYRFRMSSSPGAAPAASRGPAQSARS